MRLTLEQVRRSGEEFNGDGKIWTEPHPVPHFSSLDATLSKNGNTSLISGRRRGASAAQLIPTLTNALITSPPSSPHPSIPAITPSTPTRLHHSTSPSSSPSSTARLAVPNSMSNTPKLYTSPFVVAFHVCPYSGAT
ncbi:hypothetical protein M5K25_005709 [Dendrobium thyrsiflorum]|uniref:Uncharacterized protein n=1 Tax=Dendrobium thyrsiflorum TaxID=117978 RepID=A0ABD0VPT8_DENTH